MTDWSDDLRTALDCADSGLMKAMLARVPKDVMQRTIPYLQIMARQSAQDGRLEDALTYYSQLIEIAPGNFDWHLGRAQVYFKLDQLSDAMLDALRLIELQPDSVTGYRLQAEAHDGLRERRKAIAAYRKVLDLAPQDEQSKQRIQFLERELHKESLLKQALDPQASQQPLHVELPPPPEITLDPALFAHPDIPARFDQPMVDGLKQHLLRYSAHQSVKNCLLRLDDPEWTSAWDRALRGTTGSSIILAGSELGLLALQARRHGAIRVHAAERFAMDARIAGGIVQKNLLAEWHALHGDAVRTWSEDERRASFDELTKSIDVLVAGSQELDAPAADYFVFPNIDHTLLGTGILHSIRKLRAQIDPHTKFLPARARIFAVAIQWQYSGTDFDLRHMNEFRWSLYPQPLELTEHDWLPLGEAVAVGDIDLAQFAERTWDVPLPIARAGNVDAIVYWYDLDLGTTTLSNRPGSPLQCIKPAVQYADSTSVRPGESFLLRMHVTESRLHFELPTQTRFRDRQLPSWYIPMLLDEHRNEAYDAALRRAVERQPAATVLDIGSGCGLLSMMASRAGAQRVIGSEASQAICSAAQDVVRTNGYERAITLINKDVRRMTAPGDLPQRAGLAVFEMFDCSLIGEGVLHFLAYAREHLLDTHAQYLPATGRIRAMIVEYRYDRILGHDVNLLNPYRFSPSFINVDARTLRYRALSAPFDVFEFDFSTATPAPQESELLVPATAAGIAGAVLFWFDLQLDAATSLSNSPDTGSLHWKQGLQYLPEVQVTSGLQMPVFAKHDGSSFNVHWKPDALPKESFSALPRLDPRWWQQARELEQQTRDLLQHCLQHPAEYQKVAELAQRLAIDPAAHNLDPLIAQRFAGTFHSA
jgi:type III protein arginine methyltransferase